MKALIQNNRVLQVEKKSFPVHRDLQWVECDSTVEAGFHYENGEFSDRRPQYGPKEFIEDYRKQAGDGPATFQGITVEGNAKTRTAIAETVQFWQELDPEDAPETIDWEGPDGFHQISLSTLIGLGKAIGFQRQKSFTVKKAVLRKIEIGDITTIEQAKAAFDQGMAS
jgi:hypothetical protein